MDAAIMAERLPLRGAALAQPVQDATDDPPIQQDNWIRDLEVRRNLAN
jgi:hypothetical protein